MPAANPPTDVSLIARLANRPSDPDAWSRFVARYGPRIDGWCRAWGMQPADADDVTQEVLLRVAKRVRTYTPGERVGSFRAWLRQIVRGSVTDYAAKDRPWHAPAGGRREAVAAINSAEARDDLLARLDEEYDLELVEAAMARVRETVEPHTWEAFRLTAVDGLSGAEAAAAVGMAVASLYAARSKVQRLIRAAIAALDADSPG